jgi:hypothetical protein
MCCDLSVQIQAMRNGDVPLQLRGHTLVLNWNSLTLSLLRQLYHAQHDPKHCLYKRPVVVLAGEQQLQQQQQHGCTAIVMHCFAVQVRHRWCLGWNSSSRARHGVEWSVRLLLLLPLLLLCRQAQSRNGCSGADDHEGPQV